MQVWFLKINIPHEFLLFTLSGCHITVNKDKGGNLYKILYKCWKLAGIIIFPKYAKWLKLWDLFALNRYR